MGYIRAMRSVRVVVKNIKNNLKPSQNPKMAFGVVTRSPSAPDHKLLINKEKTLGYFLEDNIMLLTRVGRKPLSKAVI